MEAEGALPTEEQVRAALCSVDDPEVGMNIVDLGLVYRIDIAPHLVRVELTMTSPACPMGDLITDNARRAVGAVSPQDLAVDVVLVWDPPWTPDLMSETARQTFGWPG
ncbi:MAG: metal-sulfur cluster assembly factor [Burkholderiales bacterium]|nr:metal-sulfur cluster assembly factor [Burkholderiales bacterium]